MDRFVFAVTVVVALCSVVSCAGPQPETGKAKPAEGNPAVFTLGTLITGTYGEIQRYAESLMGVGVIRSAVEVRSGASCVSLLFPSHLLFQPFGVTSLFDWLFFNQYLFTNFSTPTLSPVSTHPYLPMPLTV